MTVQANELPDLIAAAVQKVVADGELTNEMLQALGQRPLTLGIIFTPAEFPAAAVAGKALQLPPNRTLGFVIRNLDELKDPNAIKAVVEAKGE